MDPDVIEIPPHSIPCRITQPKNKKMLREVINIDDDEDLADEVVPAGKVVDSKNKGKAVQDQSNSYHLTKGVIILDDLDSDDDNNHVKFFSDDIMDLDDYESEQSQFDSVNIPTLMDSTGCTINGGESVSSVNPMLSNAFASGSSKPVNVNNKLNQVLSGSLQVSTSVQCKKKSSNQSKRARFSNACFPVASLNHSPVVGSPKPSFKSKLKSFFINHTSHSNSHNQLHADHIPPREDVAIAPKTGNEEILRKFQEFKHFDTVEDHSDHHYKGNSIKKPSKAWTKSIQKEWKIMESSLPDAIFVRVYETRMDLLRAVIVGAECTPYHDGLFFFDVFFPNKYPNSPPLVYYHSGGLRLNPNLYQCGKVCLSLLGTWSGSKNEKWIPNESTVLQVLVSIQALVLNQKPYFNEPGFERMSGTKHGEINSQKYNEKAFSFSLQTMVYSMRRPPKHFEDFVLGHFHKNAHDILMACKAYMDGAQVGCVVKGGAQDVDAGEHTCSKGFKENFPAYVDLLVKEFIRIGVEDVENFTKTLMVENNLPGTSSKTVTAGDNLPGLSCLFPKFKE